MRMSDWSSDVCASDLMGLPVAKLVVATNVNDILHRALTRGDYSAGHVTPTATPSMDIQVSSNFERLLFDPSGRDGGAIRRMMAAFDASRALSLQTGRAASGERVVQSGYISVVAGSLKTTNLTTTPKQIDHTNH